MASRALLAFQGRAWCGASLNEMAGAMLMAEFHDNVRVLKTFAVNYAKSMRKRGRKRKR